MRPFVVRFFAGSFYHNFRIWTFCFFKNCPPISFPPLSSHLWSSAPRDPPTRWMRLWGAPVQRRFCCGGRRGCSVLSGLLRVWVIGDCGVLAVPNAACWGGIGGAQRIRDVGSATLLRLVAPPEVTAAHRLLPRADAVLVPAALPVRFLEPMGGESGDGGLRGDGGTGGAGMRCGSKVRWARRLTRRRRY